jgi:hypothetical protein
MTNTQSHPDSLRFTLGVALRVLEICEETLLSIKLPERQSDIDDVLCRITNLLDCERPARHKPNRS